MEEVAARNDLAACALDALAIGVIVTDSQGRRLYANAAADRLLSQPAGALRCCSAGRVSAGCHDTRHSLRTLISTVCGRGACATNAAIWNEGKTADRAAAVGNYILLSSSDRISPNLAVCILPVGAAGPGYRASHLVGADGGTNAMMLVRPIERDCNLEIEAERLLGLSKAEARLASRLGAGLSFQEAADAQGVALATARSHLKSIFRKTSLKRQSQLVALLRSTQIPVERARHVVTTGRSNAKADTAPARAPCLPQSAEVARGEILEGASAV